MHFLWIEDIRPLLFVQVGFFSLDASISEDFLIGQNRLLNHFSRADQIAYKLDSPEF